MTSRTSVPLTPTEIDLFACKPNDYNLENVCFAAPLTRRCDPANLERALAIMAARHDSLRLRFGRGESGWEKWLLDADDPLNMEVRVVDLEGASPETAEQMMDETHISLRTAINVTEGPVVIAAYYRGYPAGGDSFGIVLSHAVCDGYAFMAFIAELQLIWRSLEETGAPPDTLPSPGSAAEWARACSRWAKGADAAAQWDHWLGIVDAPPPPPPSGFVTDAPVALAGEETGILLDTDEVLRVESRHQDRKEFHHLMEARVLAAWLSALRDEWGMDDFLVSRIVNGRKAPFLQQHPLVGWLMIYHPLRLRLASGDAPIKLTSEALSSVPTSGHGFGALCFLSGDPRAAQLEAGYEKCGLLFNYLGGGVVDRHGEKQLFGIPAPCSPMDRYIGEQDGLEGRIGWNLYLLSYLQEGKLFVTSDYDRTMLSNETVQRILKRTGEHLRELLQL